MNSKLKSERQDSILKEVLRRGPVSIGDLAAFLQVSEITVRRDLDELHANGSLERVRGGARPLSPRDPEPPIVTRLLSQANEKQAIGQAAVELISDGDVIALESGSTTLEFARAIARHSWHNLQVVTNGHLISEILMRVPGVQLVCIGGYFKPEEMCTFGVLAEDMLSRMRFNKLFIGCRGIDPEGGITTDLQSETEVFTVRAMAAAADQLIILADHTKFGHKFLLRALSIAKVDIVITDPLTPAPILDKLRKQDTQVIIVPLENTTTGADALREENGLHSRGVRLLS
jgi:DeoR/GlpR family transcriptional regulator of sugar metabolism